MKIKHFGNLSRAEYSELMKEMELHLKSFADAHGLMIKQEGGGRYTSDGKSLTIKMQLNVVGSDGTVVSKEASDFLAMCTMYGFEKSDLGKKFKHQGDVCEIVGLMRRRSKYPIQCRKASDGKIILFPETSVKALLKAFPA